MPSSPSYKRNYAQERRTAVKRGETSVGSKSEDTLRHKARRKYIAAHGKSAAAGKDIDHKIHLSSGGSNSLSNLRARSIKANRSDNGQNPKRGNK